MDPLIKVDLIKVDLIKVDLIKVGPQFQVDQP